MAKNNNHNNPAVNIKNRRATFDYEIIETFTAGIVLTGTEIKSIRQGKCGLTDTYCMVINGEVWVKNMYIAEYSYGSYNNHTTHRDRKLLLNRKEIRRIAKENMQPGNSIVPLRLFINERGLAKLVIAIARGKKQYDKRQSIKEREDKRAIDRMFKH
ncbi:MAG: SsrA-binding protein SmpB [Muribaculaceae bacterium]|nr:SsrA-binding protein SmpB [Muribaculaceae bacterium]